MKTGSSILVGLGASIFTIWIVAYQMENGDINAMSMYFVVFLVPITLLILLNGLLLKIASRVERISYQRVLTLIPILICCILIFGEDLNLSFIDGSISFIGIVGIVGIGLTNIIWNIKLQKN